MSFWKRMGLREEDRATCIQSIQTLYPNHTIEEFSEQGQCSFTLLATLQKAAIDPDPPISIDSSSTPPTQQTSLIIQIRPKKHSLNSDTIDTARHIYGSSLIPSVRNLPWRTLPGLHAYEMEKKHGVPYSRLQPQHMALDPPAWAKQVMLVKSFVSFIAKGWPTAPRQWQGTRADSPLTDETLYSTTTNINAEANTTLSQWPGKIRSTIPHRLATLAQHLPSPSLRHHASRTLSKLPILSPPSYPTILTHGDLLPSNILLDPQTFTLRAVVDWAEAEYLPFGVHLYALEHLLGYLDTSSEAGVPRFRYYERSEDLRELFWESLCGEAGEGLSERVDEVRVARDVGVLLWYGFAWDGGKVDRIVDERVDEGEVECLRVFLGAG